MKSKYFILTMCVISVLLLLSFVGDVRAQISCTEDADCDDQLFCTGTEMCIDGTCAAVSACPPAIDGCVTRGFSCDEENDMCIDFADDSLCAEGEICDIESGACIEATFTCGMAQLIVQEAVASGGPYRNHGQMVKTAAHAANPYLYEGAISEECHSCIVSQFARRIPIEQQEVCE